VLLSQQLVCLGLEWFGSGMWLQHSWQNNLVGARVCNSGISTMLKCCWGCTPCLVNGGPPELLCCWLCSRVWCYWHCSRDIGCCGSWCCSVSSVVSVNLQHVVVSVLIVSHVVVFDIIYPSNLPQASKLISCPVCEDWVKGKYFHLYCQLAGG